MIFTEKKITINNNECKIDSPVVLYRGDYNVEIRFNIVSSPYKYSNKQETNVIESTEAGYAQLVINTPNDGTPIFSEIVATKKGAVTFTITADMIDESVEVGQYTFQIRLFDDDQESRATIAEVINGIEIREPIATEDVSDTNKVDVAVVDYAVTTYAADEDAFDDNGKYITTTWAGGQRITSANLNKIEAGITGANDRAIDALDSIPTATSELENDSGFITTSEMTEAINNISVDLTGYAKTEDIPNSTSVEDGKLYLLKNDGTKIDTGTDLPINSNNSSIIQTYITEDIGELYLAPSDYTAWCPGNLRFDENLNKFVSLIHASPAHVHSTSDLYISYIDKDFVASDPVKCKFVDTDGSTDITPTQAGSTAFIILDDGTYMMPFPIDGTTYRFISSDNGLTWVKNETVVGFSGSPWGMTKLSDGRLICGDDSSKVGIYYSDDSGVNWTQVIPTTCGGNYEAEVCILELEPNNLIGIGRYSMSGMGYYESGDSEHAIISYSTDNGNTWSDWQLSNTIDNMNASSCTGLVHDGIVEIFTTSRWYSNGANINTDNANTGKNGAMIHYTATIENALNDNFTRKDIVCYAQGAGGEFHSPCVAVDDNKNILICHMDGGSLTTCNHRFVRGSIDNINYIATDNSKSPAKAYSAKFVEDLIQGLTDKINTLQFALSQIEGSGVTPPANTWIRLKHWNADDSVTDSIYPYTEDSDFYGLTVCGSETVSEFKTDDDGNNYAKMYAIICGVEASDIATDFKLTLQWSHEYSYFVVIKDGYVTAVGIRGGGGVYDDNNSATKITNISSKIEVYDGGCIIDGKEYELTKATPEQFIENIAGINNGAYVTGYSTAVKRASASSTDSNTDYNKNYVGFFAQQYQNYYDIGYWEIH